jgi:nitric oxide reductase subunit B
MFTVGISLFIYDFIKYGKPTDEALEEKSGNVLSGKKINNIPNANVVYTEETN